LTIVKNYDRVVVWLDDDAAGHAASMKIFKEISPLVKNVTSINMQQPKEIPYLSLKDMEL
jgi:DNA primase